MLSLQRINKTYRQSGDVIRVLVNVDFTLPDGHAAALLGESGSGKSTLLHLLSGLDTPDSGIIRLGDRDATAFSEAEWNAFRRDSLGLVFQQYHLVPTLTVQDNIRLQARLSNRSDPILEQRLTDALGLGALMKRLPHQLSGGQQQRVAIARALNHRPRLILADEPTGNLDEGTSESVMRLFVELTKETGSSLLMVTHSLAMASYMDSRWRLHDGAIAAEDD